jgi:hypothetical protein
MDRQEEEKEMMKKKKEEEDSLCARVWVTKKRRTFSAEFLTIYFAKWYSPCCFRKDGWVVKIIIIDTFKCAT